MTEGSASLAMDGRIQIWIPGNPQPFPKKKTGIHWLRGGKPRLIPVDIDYRIRTDPTTGKVTKFDHGYKRKWMDHVRDTVDDYMFQHNLKPFPKNDPIALGLLFFLPKSPSCKLEYPSQAPDGDNYDYAVWNALKRTPAKRMRDGRVVAGKYPNGVLFYDDDQIVWRLHPSGWLWANDERPRGVLITVCSALDMRSEIEEFAARKQLELI